MATPTGAHPPVRTGGIVVGVDDSPESRAALRWAVREGASRGLQVHAVTAWEPPMESTFGEMATVGDLPLVVAAEQTLVAALAAAEVDDDDERVTTTPVEGHPAEVLMRRAETADLLVVGSRGHGRILGALLGSVSRYVAAHAACPVVVIESEADDPR